MAIGNWETYSINNDMEPCRAQFVTPLGVVANIYKNWIYVMDEAGWTDGGFCKPTVAEIWSGCLRYKDLSVTAIRGPQGGVYCACWFGYQNLEGFYAMYGIGCYGYKLKEWIGVTEESKQYLEKFIRDFVEKGSHEIYYSGRIWKPEV